MTERESTVAIIGGLGRMGRVTGEIFEKAGYNRIISDIKDSQTLSPREAIRQAGIVFFSVLPIENIGSIIRESTDVFDAEHLVLDNASFKDPLRSSYEMLDEKHASICSTHPLCKEDQPLSGQSVVIAPFGQNPHEATRVAEEVYQRAGMVLIPIDFEKHDSTLLYNQLLPHIVNRAVSHVLTENNIDLNALLAVSTANSRLFLIACCRTLVQPPEMSAMLISKSLRNPEGEKLVQGFIDSINTIRQSTPEKLEEAFSEDVASLDPTGEIRTRMNEESIIILQHLANLAKRSFTVETHKGDKPGLLYEILGVIGNNQINLNTVLSQMIKDGFKFHLGIEEGELTSEVIEKLKELEAYVTSVTA